MRVFNRFLFLSLILCMMFLAVSAQRKSAPKKTPAKVVAPPAAPKSGTTAKPSEISGIEWSNIADALDKENWTQATRLTFAAMNKLKADNDKKQLAQLRYFYLFALAGQAANGSFSYADLEKTADGFIGTEFLMPSRQFLADCTKKVNYICQAKDDENVLRVTATDKSGSAIHSFEYIKFDAKPVVAANDGKSAFLGGVLKSVEVNKYKQNISILRLVFDKGFANLTAAKP